MRETKGKKEEQQKRGLYFALAVCLVAIAVAGFSAYGSIMDYISEKNQPAIEEEYAVAEREDPETVVNTVPDVSSQPQPVIEEEAESSEIVEEYEEIAYPEEPVSESEIIETAEEQVYTPSEILSIPVSSDEIIKEYSDGLPVFCSALKDYRVHNAVDIKANVSEAVFAAGNGKVMGCYNDLLLGNVIEIEHGDYTIKYCGLGDTFLVSEGDIVSKNTAIGSVYSVPMEKDDEPHLHIEVIKDGSAINPMDILIDE